MQKKRLLFLFLIFYKTLTFSQLNLSGIVLDEKNEPLPFVNILINESTKNGVSTDIDGKFSIQSKAPIQKLTLSFVGFEKLIYEVGEDDFGKKLKLRMKSTSFELAEAVVIAGENPAHRIIRKAVKNRNKNNPEKIKSYSCKTYNKVVVGLLPDEKGIQEFQEKHKDSEKKLRKTQIENFNELIENNKKRHVMIMESVSERKFKYPEKISEHVIHNRVSGFKNPSFVALANAFQPFAFYQQHIEILDKAYLNPISPNSTKKYFFNIVDTLLQNTDSVFVISYKPRKGKNFEGLKGVLYINTNGFALQNVIAEPNDKSFIKMKIEQRYKFVDNQQWFPEQLNFVIEATKYPNKHVGSRISGKSYINEVNLNPQLRKKDFRNEGYTTDKNANIRSDSIWQIYRPQDLTIKEKETYHQIDSIGQKEKFDQLLLLGESLANGRLPLGKVDLLIRNIFRVNDFEGLRLGAGFATNDLLSPFFEIGAYGGYGFKDKSWKYGGHLLFDFLPKEKLQLLLNYEQDIFEPATLRLTYEPQLVSRQLYAFRMDQRRQLSAQLRGKIGKPIRFNLSLSQSTWQPQYEYQFNQSDLSFEKFNFTEVGLDLRFAYRETVVKVLGTEIPTTRFPILYFSYKKGLDDFWNGEFDYQKFSISLEDNFRIRGFGETSLRIEAGLTEGDVPYNQLYAASGIGRGFQWVEIPNTFQTMDIYEFLSDRFIHVFFEHNFGALLLKHKNFKPEISLAQNIAWGDLQKPELHNGFDFKTLEDGFFESGLRIDNLLRFNYVNIMYMGIGGGIYYRWGKNALPTFEENLGYRARLRFTF